MEQVLVGIITKPQALKGEFRIKPQILNMKQFKKIKTLFIDKKAYELEKVVLRDTFVIAKVQGVDSCEQAELLRNKEVFAEMEIDTSDNFDLSGFEVYVGDNCIGQITDINNYGSKDIISIKYDNPCMLPLVDNLVINIDKENKKIILDAEIFEQVVVYEN